MANSLYDSYKLSNSTVVPMFQGSSAPEGLLVGKHLQGMYDLAKDGAFKVLEGSDGLSAMGADQKHLENVRNKITGDIEEMTKAGDWENKVDPVRGLGRYYVARARELAAPLQQYQKWTEEVLNNKEKNLTPAQKQILDLRAKAGYKGLQDDGTGRLVGGFQGIEPAKNIDVAELSDKLLRDRVIQEGGTDYSFDNGVVTYKRGDKWKTMTPDEISTILKNGLALNTEYQAFKDMESENAAFVAKHTYRDISEVPIDNRADVQKLLDQGYDLPTSVAAVVRDMTASQIDNTADDYVRNKYKQNDRWTENADGMGDVAKADAVRKASEEDQTMHVVQDELDATATNFGNLEEDRKTYLERQNGAMINLKKAKSTVASVYDLVPGRKKGDFAALNSNEQEDVIRNHYNSIAGGSGLYTQLLQDRQSVAESRAKIEEIDNTKKIIENYVMQNKHGATRETLGAELKTILEADLRKQGTGKTMVIYGGEKVEMTNAQLADLIKGGTYEGSTTGNYMGGANRQSFSKSGRILNTPGSITDDAATLTLRDANNKEIKIPRTPTNSGLVGKLVRDISQMGKVTAEEIQAFGKEAMENYSRSQALVIPGKKDKEVLHGAISGAAKVFYNENGDPLQTGTDEVDRLNSLVAAGDFKVLGLRTEVKNGQVVSKISVQDKNDKDALPTTVLVGTTGTTPGALSAKMIRESKDANGNIKDVTLYNSGRAMAPGSSFNMIKNTKMGDKVAEVSERTIVKGPKGKDVVVYKPIMIVENGRPNNLPGTTVKKPDGTILKEYTDLEDIGARLDEYRENSNYQVKYK